MSVKTLRTYSWWFVGTVWKCLFIFEVQCSEYCVYIGRYLFVYYFLNGEMSVWGSGVRYQWCDDGYES